MRVTESITTDQHGQVVQTTQTVAPPAHSTVEITQNAKGMPQLTVKVLHEDPETALREAVRLYRQGLLLLSPVVQPGAIA